MRNHLGFSLMALVLLAPTAAAGGGGDDLDRVHVPALKDISVTASPGHGVTFDGGDEFKLNIYNRLQVQWQFSDLDQPTAGLTRAAINTFRVRRARTRFRGHVYSPKTQFQLYLEWARGGNNILDAWIKQELWSDEQWTVSARVGAMKTHYGKEFTGSSGSLELVDRSLAARTFTGRRSTGLLFLLAGLDDKLHAHAGVFNNSPAAGDRFGSTSNTTNPDNELDFTAGARYDVNGDMGGEGYAQGDLNQSQHWNASLHGNVWIGNQTVLAGNTTLTSVGPGADVEVVAFNAGGAFKYKGFHALGEFFFQHSEVDLGGFLEEEDYGWNLQGSYTHKSGWGLAGRVSVVSIDNKLNPGAQLLAPLSTGTTGGGTALPGTGDIYEYTVGINRYFNGHGRKVQADFTFQSVDPQSGALPDNDNLIFRIMATLNI